MKSVRYSLIYRFFAAQIQFGYYRAGDPLPSMEELCRVYRASPRTVRNAYLQLQQDGYVRLSPGRRTAVVYAAAPAECDEYRRAYYLARREVLPPLNEAMELLLLPLLREGCGQLSRRALRQVRETAVRLESGDFYVSFLGGRAMLLACKNRLALDLYDEVVTFYQFPHALLRSMGGAAEQVRFRALSARAVAACDRGDREGFFQTYLQIQVYMNRLLGDYMAAAARLLPPQEQAAFAWGVYRERPQRCYSLAARLIGQVYFSCAYAPGDPLPGYAALAQEHQVSYMTVRRTMELLEALGVVRVRHGVGAAVTRTGPDLSRCRGAALRKLHTMALEALQLLRFALDGIGERLDPCPPEGLSACLRALRAQRAQGLRFPALLVLLDGALRAGANGPLETIWDKLLEALLLDMPLLEAAAGRSCHGPEALLAALEAGDGPAVRGALHKLLAEVWEAALALEPRLSQ